MRPLWFDGPVVISDVELEHDTSGNDEALTSDDEMELSDLGKCVSSSDSDDDY